MKYAHLVKLTVFSHESEDIKSVSDALLGFFPFNLESDKIPIKETAATGFNGKKIKIFEVILSKQSLVNELLKNLESNLTEAQKGIILKQSESRLDSNLDFFIRFDKDSWINEKKLLLTNSGSCFHLRIAIAAFPKKREAALKIIKDLFEK